MNILPLARSWRPSPLTFDVAPPVPAAGEISPPLFQSEMIDPAMLTPTAHVASVCEVSGGRLLATWHGGAHELHREVAIFMATRGPGDAQWSRAVPVVTHEIAQRETDRYVRKVGNTVVFSDGGERVWLLYVSMALYGWSGSSLNLKTSTDGGRTWGGSERLMLNPLWNMSELSKNKPARLSDGGWCVPIYYEMMGKFTELLWLPGDGGARNAVTTRPFGITKAFQPALVPLSARTALLACRDFSRQQKVQLSRTEDAGRSWSTPAPSALPNPNSGLDAIRLRDGRVLLAFNDSTVVRDVLRLAVSADGGVTWRRVCTLENEAIQDFSYPFLLQTRDGLIHAVYSWKRKGIKHVAFNTSWLDARSAGDAP